MNNSRSEREAFNEGFNSLSSDVTADGKLKQIVDVYYNDSNVNAFVRNMYDLYIEAKCELVEKDKLNKKLVNALLTTVDK